MPNNAYRAAPGMNWSTLKHILTSPRQLVHAIDNPIVPSAAMEFGTAVHAAILEPDYFDAAMMEIPQEFLTASGSFSTAKAARDWKASLATRCGVEAFLLTSAQLDAIARIRARVADHTAASSALELCDRREQGLYWVDSETGIECKCCPDAHSGFRVLDVKTWSPRGKFSADAFMREAVNRGYLGQLGFYAMGIEGATGHKVEVMQFLVLQSTEPYDVMLLELDIDAMEFAIDQAREALNLYCDWVRDGRPDRGAEPDVVVCNLPWNKTDDVEDGAELEGL